MMKRNWQLTVIFLAAVLLSGCVDMSTEILVRKDGSGTVTETAYFSPMLEGMMQSMAQGMNSAAGNSGQPTVIQEPPIDMEKYGKKAEAMGPGVRLVSAEKVARPDGAKGEKIVYAFENIKTLRWNADPDIPSAGGSGEDNAETTPVIFDFVAADRSTLTIRLPHKQESASADTPDTPAVAGAQTEEPNKEADAAQFEQMKMMFSGTRMAMSVKVEGEIKETNAAHVGSSNGTDKDLVTLFDMDIGKLLSSMTNPEEFKAINANIKDMGTAMTKLQGIPGLVIEPAEEIVISFAGRDVPPEQITGELRAGEISPMEPVSLPSTETDKPDTYFESGAPQTGNSSAPQTATIYLKSGGKISGEIISKDEEFLTVQSGAAKITVQADQVEKVE